MLTRRPEWSLSPAGCDNEFDSIATSRLMRPYDDGISRDRRQRAACDRGLQRSWSRAMDAFRRLQQLSGTEKQSFHRDSFRSLSDPHLRQVRRVSLEAWTRSVAEKARSWATSHPNMAFAPVGVLAVLYLLMKHQAAAAATLAGAWFALARHFAQPKQTVSAASRKASQRPSNSLAATSLKCAWVASMRWSGFLGKARTTIGQ